MLMLALLLALAPASAHAEDVSPVAAAEPASNSGAETVVADATAAVTEPPAANKVATADVPLADAAPAEEAPDIAGFMADVDALWTCLAAFLVFFMQAGFCLVESGFTRAKNACNIVMKNLMDLSVGSLIFWLFGFGLMFGATSNGLYGTNNFLFDAASADATAVGNTVAFGWAFLIFQTVFAATAATIVSGAMAERTKFGAYLLYSIGITAIVYPIFGSWAWGSLWAGDGWLEGRGFYDFAGSTVVHSVGGWAALAGALVIGPRLGKYGKDGRVNPIPGHNIPMGALGVFILWLGWFGFNSGSTTAVGGGDFARIAVTTNLAAAAGAIGALLAAWVAFRKPDPTFALNGALAGLVAITAGCDVMSPAMAVLTGLLGGFIVVGSVVFFDKLRIDDPVGAISVHGVCGAWGTLAVGLFGTEMGLLLGHGSGQLVTQLIGVGAGFAWAFSVSLGIFLAIKYTVGLRVSEQEEMEGLDLHEHGILAYPPVIVAESFTGSGVGGYAPVPAGGGAAPVISTSTAS